MQAVIIAGGKGTRLSPLTLRSPKPMLPLFDRPFLRWMVERCQQVGLTDILMNIRYQATQIQDYFGDGHDFGVQIRYVIENEALDTAGAMKLAEPFYTGEPLVVFNADILTDLDLKALMQVHEQTQAQATIALARVPDPTAFGLVELVDLTSDNGYAVGTIRSFQEKPTEEEAKILGIDTVNAGTYVLNPEIFEQYGADHPLSFERTVFPNLLANQQKITGLVWEGYWLDLGTPAKFYGAHTDILQRKMSFPLPAGVQEIQPQVWVAQTAMIDAQARLMGPCFVGDHTHLGSQAEISSGVILGSCCFVDRPLLPGIYPPGTLAV
jgi:mannose-1-phosphate guanylyltransferase/mannose-1-phosphate guanylyltransferase/phosphomannomutase